MADTRSAYLSKAKDNLEAIRKRARQHIEQGAVTAAYKADRNAVVSLLNDALAGAERQE